MYGKEPIMAIHVMLQSHQAFILEKKNTVEHMIQQFGFQQVLFMLVYVSENDLKFLLIL